METKKTFWQAWIGTLIGSDGEGSAKRITMAFICLFLLLPMELVHEYCYYLAVVSLKPTEAQMIAVKSYEGMNFAYQITLWMFAGLATIETITSFIKAIITFIRGGKIEEKASNS